MPSPGSEAGVFLVGMMGAGKSSVGAQLAEKLDLRFVDLDVELEREAKRTVAEIFALEGETGFRVREARLLRALDVTRTIVATGGGVVTQPGLVEHMRVTGRVVYLRATIDTLVARLAGESVSRPLLQGDPRAVVERLLDARRAEYERAHVIIDTDGLDLHAVVERVRESLE
jgi:shikimate kinase